MHRRAAALLVGLSLAACAAPAAGAAQQPRLIGQGAELYAEGCISCHGPDGLGVDRPGPALGAEGVRGLGPSLVGVGALSADFYLRTGYMPMSDPYARPERNEPPYSEQEIRALVAYVASLGDGPPVPEVAPQDGDVAEGLRAFTESCAGCHQTVGEGGVVLAGGIAPALHQATPTQIAQAIRIGPHVMPAFSEERLDDATVNSIIAYLQYARSPRDEGGWGIGHIGPVAEGLVAWLVAGIGLVTVARMIGRRT